MKYAFGLRERLDDVEMPDFVKLFADRGETVREISVGALKRFEINDGIPTVHQVLIDVPKPPRTLYDVPALNLYFEVFTNWINGGQLNGASFSTILSDITSIEQWAGQVCSIMNAASAMLPESRTIFIRIMEERGCVFTISSENT